METLDDIIRFSAFGLLLWLAVLTLRDFCDRVAGKLAALSALTSAGYLLGSKPGLSVFGVDLDLILLPLFVASPVFVWFFCLSQFDDNFQIKAWHKTVLVTKMVTGAVGYVALKYNYAFAASIWWPSTLIVIGMMVHLVYVTWQGRNDDLVEDRRKIRSIFVLGVIAISAGIVVAETWLRGVGIGQYLLVGQATAFLVITTYLLWRLSSPGGQDLFFKAPQTAVATSGEAHCELTPADRHDLDVILGLGGTDLVLEPGLTITKLASRLKIPEHRLRHLINQHMGYRNFADFLNHHRIQAAKARLSNIEDRNIPVLTVAMDMGYGSLGPFNRAFKERTGLTPTEFRTQSLLTGDAALTGDTAAK